MVVLYSKEGQLANRLWQSAHFIANAIENEYRLIHLGFAEYQYYFDENLLQLEKNYPCFIRGSKSISFFDKLILVYTRLAKRFERHTNLLLPFIQKVYFLEYSSKRYSIATPNFKRMCKRKITLVDGWFFDDRESIYKHASILRKALKPNSTFLKNIDWLKNSQFSQFDLIVGLHIRRGDYKSYKNGIWFYTDEEYVRIMKKVLSLDIFKERKTALFICSNEKVDRTLYKHFNVIESTRNQIEDLYALAICNFIVGPPSTYSAWASFYGNVPILHLTDRDMKITEKSFKLLTYGYE